MIASFIDGPLWYFSLAAFVTGVIWKLFSRIFGQRKTDLCVPRGSAVQGSIKREFSRFAGE